jgi:phospholipid/cholesterol/gamma-HCH transport system substrate-binding protein
MPSKERVTMAQLKVGVLGIVALCCIILLIFLLTGGISWFKNQVPLQTFVSDAAGLTPDAPVRINGIPAGSVTGVALSGERNPSRAIRINFVIDKSMLKDIPVDSVASINSENLLGSSKFLEITKGSSLQTVEPHATLKATNTQEFDALVQQGYNVLDSLQAILAKVSDIVGDVENGNGTIGKLLTDQTLYKNLQDTVTQVQILATTLNSKNGTVGHLINDNTLYNQIQAILARLDTITAGLEQGQGSAGMFLKDPKIYNDLDKSLDQLNTILTNLNAGKGTAGQLLVSNKLSNQLSATLTKVDTTIDRVNSGKGTIGQLMVNPSLYDNLNGATADLRDLLKAFRANPKKYLSVKLHIF